MNSWKTVGERKAVTTGTIATFDVDGTAVCVVEAGGSIHAFGRNCPHMRAPLSRGLLSKDTIECPLHHGAFRVNTGEVASAPQMGGSMPGMEKLPQATLQAFMQMGEIMSVIDCPNLVVFPVREADGKIEVQL